jgi:hypothetical protein
MNFKNVVLPVPAFPVKKTGWLLLLIKSAAVLKMILSSSGFCIRQCIKNIFTKKNVIEELADLSLEIGYKSGPLTHHAYS